MKWIGRLVVVIILLGGCVAAASWYMKRSANVERSYRTSTVSRGDIVSTIAATGTLEPQEVVDVGSQVAAQILEFGVDDAGRTVDYGSKVKAKQLLAKLDDKPYQADYDSTMAQIASAKAGVIRAQADLDQSTAKLEQAQRDWDRAQKLGSNEALAQTTYDNYKATFDIAKATVGVSKAALEQAKTTVAQTEASLVRVKRNLEYCTITSPVDGVIIDRRVNIGQTVVASLNAPSLFLIAKDLSHLDIWVSVNEADIGKIFPGQPVTFVVDAFAGATFTGKVDKIRLNAQMTQNVVTYTVEVNTDNTSGQLLPYMTANAQFEVDRRTAVLTVPNAALRYMPDPIQMTPEARDAMANDTDGPPPTSMPSGGGEHGGNGEHHGGGHHHSTSGPASRPGPVVGNGIVWVQDASKLLKPVHVKTGLSDGINTEVWGDDVKDSLEIVTGENLADVMGAGAGGGSPFAPSFGRRNGGRK